MEEDTGGGEDDPATIFPSSPNDGNNNQNIVKLEAVSPTMLGTSAPAFFTAPADIDVATDQVVLVYHSVVNGTGATTTVAPDGSEAIGMDISATTGNGDEDTQQLYLGRLIYKDRIHIIREPCIYIGRNSTKSSVNFHVSNSNFISRKHLQLTFQSETGDFFIKCLSKNGIFVDKSFQRTIIEPVKLPKT